MDVLDQGLLKKFLDKIDQPRKQQISIIINNEDIQKKFGQIIANNRILIKAIQTLSKLNNNNTTNSKIKKLFIILLN